MTDLSRSIARAAMAVATIALGLVGFSIFALDVEEFARTGAHIGAWWLVSQAICCCAALFGFELEQKLARGTR